MQMERRKIMLKNKLYTEIIENRKETKLKNTFF